MSAIEWVRRIYLYIFSTVGLVLIITGSVQFINLGLKTYVFTKADFDEYPRVESCIEYEKLGGECIKRLTAEEQEEMEQNRRTARRQQQAAIALAQIIVGVPLFVYHWRLARKEK